MSDSVGWIILGVVDLGLVSLMAILIVFDIPWGGDE